MLMHGQHRFHYSLFGSEFLTEVTGEQNVATEEPVATHIDVSGIADSP
jgi:hypothetical protein